MKTLKTLLTFLLVLALCLSLGSAVLAAPADDPAKAAADHLYSLGLFRGTGTDAAGNPIYELDRAPSRAEAVTMLVRLLGKDAAAQSGSWTIPFTDVPDWAVPYVGYAYANKLTNGVSATEFGSTATASATMYITFVLRALGYSDAAGDFAWDKAWELSDSLGITDGSYNAGNNAAFTRGGVAIVSNNALDASYKGAETTLLEKLQEEGAVPKSLKIAVLAEFVEENTTFDGVAVTTARTWSEANDSEFKAFRVGEENQAAVIANAVDAGYNVFVGAGFTYAFALKDAAAKYPDAYFIALDTSAADLEDEVPDNLICLYFAEELCGFLAGYAAVGMGYTKLGFMGGMDIPAVRRYGAGFVQGVNLAGGELDLPEVTINYAYTGQFWPDGRIETAANEWYRNGTEVIFSCGGSICENVFAAADGNGAKAIGVDMDQAGDSDTVITSAMKGVGAALRAQLSAIRSGEFKSGEQRLGLVSAEQPELNYAQLPLETTKWNESFGTADYKALLGRLLSGEISVSNDIDNVFDYAKAVSIQNLGTI